MNVSIVQFTVSLDVHDGKLAEFESLAERMSTGTEGEPGALAYYFCFNPERTQCRLVERYASQTAVLAHLTGPVVQQLVPKMLEVASLTSFEVYGDPGPEATKVLHSVGARIYPAESGFSR